MSTYVFDQGWHGERERLTEIEGSYDGYSRQRMAALGVGDGWRCLEVGFGAGSLALWLADQVGSAGQVTAVDIDPRFLDGQGRANLDVRKFDILTDELEDGSFDLAHTRAVLEHLPERQRALERMISAVRPGGWLMLEGIDFGGVMAAALAHYVSPTEHAPLFERMFLAIEAGGIAAGADPSYGSRLVRTLTAAGLVNVTAETHAPIVAGGTESWIPGTLEQLSGLVERTGLISTADIEAALAVMADPSCSYAPCFMVTATARRPS